MHSSKLERSSMLKFSLLSLLLLLAETLAETQESYLLQTASLPDDLNFMPSLANGHVGYTVYGDAIFMNGIYNGAAGNSRRARIPNWLNIESVVCDRFGCLSEDDVEANGTTYEMDLRDGYYVKRQQFTGFTLEQRTYPHRYYNRALIYEVVATRSSSLVGRANAPLFLNLTRQPVSDSDAIDIVVLNAGSSAEGDYRLLRGRTEVVEFERFQPAQHEIYVLFSEWLQGERLLDWPAWQGELRHSIVITIDRNQSVARQELQDVLGLNAAVLFQRHTEQWHEFWDNSFSVEIGGDLELARIANAGIFYMVSSLPSLSSNHANDPFYGLSPTGLARGNLDSDYQGHSFWDTEMWMLFVATQFHYDYGKILLDYRLRNLQGARYNAHAKGYKGARFPWESAYTGTEVTNPCCPEVAQQEIHISPDIVFALQKFFGQSDDHEWVCEKAWPIALEVAEFLVSRATCDDCKPICHFYYVMGPDEDHPNVDDNVYTNAVAKIALEFAEWAGPRCGNESTEPLYETWKSLRERILILHDTELDYHPQHQGYQRNTTVKQADTILIGYPLQYAITSSTTFLNDLLYYANFTRESGPAMTWSMFAANFMATKQSGRANEFFERGYKPYVRPEFKVWSETPIGYEGSANFLTGFGGFLQALIFGYGGLNFGRVGDGAVMMRRFSDVPPNVSYVQVKYIGYARSHCTFFFQAKSSSTNCHGRDGQTFELVNGKQRTLLGSSFNVTLKRGDPPLYIRAL